MSSFPKLFTALSTLLLATMTFLITITIMIQPASARIVSITAPKSPLHPGDLFNVTFHTEDFIQNDFQYYVIFGLARPELPESYLWELLDNGYDLVSHGHSNTGHGTFKVPLTIPKGFTPSSPKAIYRLTAAITGTVSAKHPHK
jgi:hypothetical protein